MKQRTANSLMSVVAGILAMFCMMLLVQEAGATEKKMPEPPKVAVEQHQGQAQGQQQGQEQTLTGTQETTATGTATSDATADVSVQGGGASTGDYVNISEHTFYSYAQADRPANGCFVSGDGANGKSGRFSALSLYWLNTNCWMDYLARGERDVVLNAELKCYARKYRKALTWDMKGSKRERTARCIEKASRSGLAMIEQERQAMQAEIDKANARTEAAKNAYELSEAHQQVCKDSLERCQEKAYGSK